MMAQEELMEILKWLDKSKNPMLLQLPKEEFDKRVTLSVD